MAKAYYWHRFYAHQPDLNFDNPQVRKAVFDVLDFWLDMGVDGLRLDAVPYLVEREGTNNENLPETHHVLKRIRAEVDAQYPDRMLLAEANQWPEETAQYFGDGDECHMAFHFPLMPRMYMAIAREDRHPITDIMRQTPEIPEGCQWAIFLRNHDELTLEMVTDQERDYLWNFYAADRRARLKNEIVGIAMLLLIAARLHGHRRGWLDAKSEEGVNYWAALYIPVVVAMAMQQNVVSAMKGGPMALLAAVLTVISCNLCVAAINRMEPADAPTAEPSPEK